MEYKGGTTLFDRVAVGFLYGICAFITYSIVWFLIIVIIDIKGDITGDFTGGNLRQYPFFINIAFIFSFILFVLGFLKLDKYVLKILQPIWSCLDKILRF